MKKLAEARLEAAIIKLFVEDPFYVSGSVLFVAVLAC